MQRSIRRFRRSFHTTTAAIVGLALTLGALFGIASPASAAPACASNQQSYTVGAGDTLYNIAKRFGTTVTDLQQQNGGSTTIKVGATQLCVPRPASAPAAPVAAQAAPVAVSQATSGTCDAGTVVYVAVSGDTLSSISRKFGISLSELRRQNNGSDSIIAGQSSFCVPGAPAAPAAPVATTAVPNSPTPPSSVTAQTTCNLLQFSNGFWVYSWCDGAGFYALIRAVEAKGIKHHFKPPYANPQKGQQYFMSTTDGEDGGEIIHVSFTGPNRGQVNPTPTPAAPAESANAQVLLANVLATGEPDYIKYLDWSGPEVTGYVEQKLIPAMGRQLEAMINESGLNVSASVNPLYLQEFMDYMRAGATLRNALEYIDASVTELFNLHEQFEMAVVLDQVLKDRVQFWWADHFGQQIGGFNDWVPVAQKALELHRLGVDPFSIDEQLKAWFYEHYFQSPPPGDSTTESNAGPAAAPTTPNLCGPNYSSCDMGGLSIDHTSCGVAGTASCPMGNLPKPGNTSCKGVSSCGSVKIPPVCGKAGDFASCKFPTGNMPSNVCNYAVTTAACNPFGKPTDGNVLRTG